MCAGKFQVSNWNLSALVPAVFKLLCYVHGFSTSTAASISRVFSLLVSIVNRCLRTSATPSSGSGSALLLLCDYWDMFYRDHMGDGMNSVAED